MKLGWAVLAAAAVLSGCGVPREAGVAAGRQAAALAALSGGTGNDAAVRTALLGQADAWEALRGTVRQKAALGVTVDAGFTALVDQAAALARRQWELIQQGSDDAADDRAALAQMQQLWADVARYLGD